MLNKKLYLLFFCIYLLTFAGRLGHRDGYVYYLSAKYFVNTGSFNITQWRNKEFMDATWYIKKNVKGEYFQVFNYGITFICIAIIYATDILFHISNTVFQEKIYYFFISILTLMAVFISGFFLNKILCLKNYSKKTNLFILVSYYFGTFIWVYSKLLFGEVIAVPFLIAAFYYLLCWEKDDKNRYIFGSGLLLGLTYFIKELFSITVPFFYLFIIISQLKKNRYNIKKLVVILSIFSVGFLVFSSIQLYLNFVHFNNILDPGRKTEEIIQPLTIPFYHGFLYILFGSNRSLFLFNPIIILFLFGLKKYFLKYKIETVVFFSMILFYIFFLSHFFMWSGAFCWGWRYILPMLFLFFLPIAELIENITLARHRLKIFAIILLCISILIQIPAVLIDPIFPYQIALKKNDWLEKSNINYYFIPRENCIKTEYKLFFNTLSKNLNINFYQNKSLDEYSHWNVWYINAIRYFNKIHFQHF